MLNITVIAYIDNLLVFTTRLREQHVKDVNKVFARLKQVECYIALEKCKFFKKEVVFLGFIVSVNGIHIDLEKIKAIIE